MANIAILGPGGWGSAMAYMTDKNGHNTSLWGAFEDEINEIKKTRENKLLKGIILSNTINITTDIHCIDNADIIIFAVPSNAVRSVCKIVKSVLKNQIIVNIGKGLEMNSFMRISEVIYEEIPNARLVIMSGPSHAEEVARGIPTANVVASKDKKISEYVQNILMNKSFRLYTSKDIIGVELGGSLKNVIALAAGICDGMGLGDNTKAALMTRGINEMVRLGVKMGAKSETFSGLTGFGDLIVTCTSMHSRNRRCGILIGEGKPVDEAIKEIGMTVEGYKTSAAAYNLAIKYNVDMPIITEIYKVLYENKDPKKTIYDLMTREKKQEHEDLWS